MAEVKDYLEKQKVKGRVRVGLDVSPKVVPIVLLRNENMPVAVIFDELSSAQQQPGHSCGKGDQDKKKVESAGGVRRWKLPFLASRQEPSVHLRTRLLVVAAGGFHPGFGALEVKIGCRRYHGLPGRQWDSIAPIALYTLELTTSVLNNRNTHFEVVVYSLISRYLLDGES
jgi:hypothetical protein